MKYVYMVQLDRSATDSDSIETELYEDYDKAYDRYKEIISEQLNNFWKNEVNFDTDGDPGEEYEFFEEDNNSNESDVYWHLSLKYDYYIHTFVDLIRTPLYTKRSDEPQYIVRYKENEYSFRSGVAAYIFHAGILNDMGKRKADILLEYVDLVYDCYISDVNNTNLGKLADYIAENWKSLRKTDRYAILEKYYSEADL